jgi:hypothetical protein
MYPETMFELIKHVITSWQVIAVTVGIVLYLNIVFYVARYYRTPKIRSIAKKISFKRKKSSDNPNTGNIDAVPGGSSANDELGLEDD